MSHQLTDIVQQPELLKSLTGYHCCLVPEFENHLGSYLPVFENFRRENHLVPSEVNWIAFPFGPVASDNSWKWRRQSLSLIEPILLGRKNDTILEIGAWNGWLTKYLAKQSNWVVAADYFTCPFDGIGNIESLAGNISALQCNLETAGSDFKQKSFDLIVLNHCLSFFKEPVAYIKSLLPLLKDGGIIIALGVTFYKNPKKKNVEIQSFAEDFLKKNQIDVFIQPVKGYLDFDDRSEFKASGFAIEPYPKMKLRNRLASLIPTKPIYASILYQKLYGNS